MVTHKLSPYEQARLDKIKRNEERLASLGLLDAKKRVRAAATTAPRQPSTPTKRAVRPKRAAAVTPSPKRASRRLKRQPVQYEPTMDDDLDLRLARKKFKKVKRETKRAASSFKCEIPDALSSPLTKAQKAVIEKKMEGDFLGKFEVST